MLIAADARAYVRTTSQHSGAPVAWLESCVTVAPDKRGSVDVPIDLVEETLARAAQNWTEHTGACGYLALSTAPATAVLDVAADGQNAVVFRHDVWARPGGMPHDPGAIGLTTVFFVDTPGRLGDASILDADVELNGVNFTFTTDPASATARPGTIIADLENTLTHELGHVQGLAHNCWDHLTDAPPLDNLGNPIPDCNSTLPASITGATMYPYARMPGETSKRNLTNDDVQGVCDVYPPTGTPPACFINVRSGCAAAGAGARSPCGNLPQAIAPLVLLLIAALGLGRARARR
ncbi:MAG TPA: hypothetical protein VFF06_32560 [Polyangia bacterium]|nr:hypothetical protein [Polyangia bacterium]